MQACQEIYALLRLEAPIARFFTMIDTCLHFITDFFR